MIGNSLEEASSRDDSSGGTAEGRSRRPPAVKQLGKTYRRGVLSSFTIESLKQYFMLGQS